MRAWIEIDLSALQKNLDTIRGYIGGDCGVYAVVKADAYGHGIEPVCRTLDANHIDGFAVIGFEEALRVRSVSSRPVLVMGYLDRDELAEAIRLGLELSVYDRSLWDEISQIAQRSGRVAQVHLKVETGLNRLGMSECETIEVLELAKTEQNIQVCGIFSHLSNSASRSDVLDQHERFLRVLPIAQEQGVPAHMVKSHALPQYPEGQLDFVRVGLAVYGFEEVIPGLIPAMSAKTVIMQRKKLAKGEGVSYGKQFVAPHDMEIAVMAMGYAEGLSLSMSEKFQVLVNGQFARQIGRVCMNLSVIDVTGIPAERGDEVVVVGTQGELTIRACDIAAWTGIRQHEIVTRLGKSLPKVYVREASAVVSG